MKDANSVSSRAKSPAPTARVSPVKQAQEQADLAEKSLARERRRLLEEMRLRALHDLQALTVAETVAQQHYSSVSSRSNSRASSRQGSRPGSRLSYGSGAQNALDESEISADLSNASVSMVRNVRDASIARLKDQTDQEFEVLEQMAREFDDLDEDAIRKRLTRPTSASSKYRSVQPKFDKPTEKQAVIRQQSVERRKRNEHNEVEAKRKELEAKAERARAIASRPLSASKALKSNVQPKFLQVFEKHEYENKCGCTPKERVMLERQSRLDKMQAIAKNSTDNQKALSHSSLMASVSLALKRSEGLTPSSASFSSRKPSEFTRSNSGKKVGPLKVQKLDFSALDGSPSTSMEAGPSNSLDESQIVAAESQRQDAVDESMSVSSEHPVESSAHPQPEMVEEGTQPDVAVEYSQVVGATSEGTETETMASPREAHIDVMDEGVQVTPRDANRPVSLLLSEVEREHQKEMEGRSGIGGSELRETRHFLRNLFEQNAFLEKPVHLSLDSPRKPEATTDDAVEDEIDRLIMEKKKSSSMSHDSNRSDLHTSFDAMDSLIRERKMQMQIGGSIIPVAEEDKDDIDDAIQRMLEDKMREQQESARQ